jgi:hypothetical protein
MYKFRYHRSLDIYEVFYHRRWWLRRSVHTSTTLIIARHDNHFPHYSQISWQTLSLFYLKTQLGIYRFREARVTSGSSSISAKI